MCGIAKKRTIETTIWAATFNRIADRRSFSTREWRGRTREIFAAFWARRWCALFADCHWRIIIAGIIKTAVRACRSFTLSHDAIYEFAGSRPKTAVRAIRLRRFTLRQCAM